MPSAHHHPAAEAAEITRASKSNLALAFIALPRARRRDMETFYAFCRVVDDIADSDTLDLPEKRRRLGLWREALADSFAGEPALARPVRAVMQRYMIPRSYFEEILAGVEMDLIPPRYDTFDDLSGYCYRVASAVGLVSIEIFGYHNLACKEYAVDLGLALQLTNILRDIAEDYANSRRIYLPLEDLAVFKYTPEDVAAHVYDERFVALMNFQAERALWYYDKALGELPREDRRQMIAAEIMRQIYGEILLRMRADGYKVYAKRYRVSSLGKIRIVVRVLMQTFLCQPPREIR